MWNRAGRRSGGDRPIEIVVPTEITCGGCDTTTPFGLLTEVLVQYELSVKCCPHCNGVLLVQKDGRWVTANELLSEDSAK
jgi:hypothetical protein